MRASNHYNVGYSSAHFLPSIEQRIRFYCGDQFPSDKNKTMLPIKTHRRFKEKERVEFEHL